MSNISHKTAFLIDDKIDQYRQKIYSIIHDGRAVQSVYKESFQPNRKEDFYSSIVSQSTNRAKQSQKRNGFSWQPYFSSQRIVIAKLDSQLEKPKMSPRKEKSPVRTTATTSQEGKQTTDNVAGTQKKKHILSAPPGSSKTNTPIPKLDWTSPIVASINRANKTESDWLKSFETLQTKRSHFFNCNTPNFENTDQLTPNAMGNRHQLGSGLVINKEGLAEPDRLIRHYSIYMPEVEIDDDGRVSVKSRSNSPTPDLDSSSGSEANILDEAVLHVEQNPQMQYSDKTSFYLSTLKMMPVQTCEVEVTEFHSATFHNFEFGHLVKHSESHTACVQSEYSTVSTKSDNLDSVSLKIIPAPIYINGEDDRLAMQYPPESPSMKKVIFSDQLESVVMIPGRQPKRKKLKRSSKKK